MDGWLTDICINPEGRASKYWPYLDMCSLTEYGDESRKEPDAAGDNVLDVSLTTRPWKEKKEREEERNSMKSEEERLMQMKWKIFELLSRQ